MQAKVIGDRVGATARTLRSTRRCSVRTRWLVAGVQDAKGKWETHLLSLDYRRGRQRHAVGNSGDDMVFGQGGNDTIYGGAGNDYLEGNEGNDTLYRRPRAGGNTWRRRRRRDRRLRARPTNGNGGDGNDVLIGDNSFNFVATTDKLPLVLHGYELNPQTDAARGTMPKRGATGDPGCDADAVWRAERSSRSARRSITARLTCRRGRRSRRTRMRAAGTGETVFASVIPDVERHLDLVAGNDNLFGDGGNDRLIGDNNAILAPFQTNLGNLLGDAEHAMSRLGWLDQMLPPHPLTTVTVASDYLDGGTGDDYLIGDSNLMLVGSAATTGNLQAGLEQAADDFDNGVEAYAKKVKGTRRRSASSRAATRCSATTATTR